MDYNSLLAAVADWAHRSDLATPAATFVEFAEARFNRKLRLSNSAAVTNVTVPSGQSSVNLPNDYQEGRALTSSGGEWTQCTAEQLAERVAAGSADYAYAVYGGAIHLPFAVTSDTALTLSYWQRIPPLSAETTSNWVLSKAPDLYLMTALSIAATYAKNPQMSAFYEMQAQTALEELRASDQGAMYFAAALQPDYVV